MSILVKPYKISVWEDQWENSVLQEKCIATIGSNEMTYQGRALEPTLVRNVNGQKKLSFKMYKYFIDNETGEKVENVFSDLLVNERKVKLYYEDSWFDFVVKDINESSSNYLFTYSLEDAIVQELSKNGFGVTFDKDLMNNLGDIKTLATEALKETDWVVDAEEFVEKVDEALVYVRIPANTKAIHLIDQDDSNLSVGVQEESYTFTSDSTVLAFYSSCRNKPHRFQFIYSNKGYGKDADGKYVIARKDDRTIIEKDCQYYIDYDNPDSYKEPSAGTNTKDLDLYLPDGFSVVLQTGGETNDTTLSSWYRGKRYGFAQQTVYVPVLEKYCQKYRREENIPLIKDKNIYHHGTQGEVKATAEETGSNELTLSGYISTEFTATSAGAVDTIQMKKKHEYVGLRLELQHHDRDTYVLKYKLKVNHGSLVTIGGHNAYYKPISYKINGVKYNINSSNDSYVNVSGAPNSEFNVEIRYEKRTPTNSGAQTDLFLQPNRGVTTYIDCTISNLSLTMEGEYLGYVDTDFISPALLQNYINNYNFESKSGWIATASNLASSSKKPEIENVYGRMDGKFISIIDDFYDGKYTTTTAYTPFMEMTFSNSNQFVLNSGPCENRTMIGNMPANDEWVLDYKILTSSGGYATKDTFSFSIGEYEYNKTTGGYAEKTGSQISFTQSSHDYDTATGAGRVIFKVSSNTYTDKTFPENSRIYVKIKPNNNYGTPAKFYLQKLSFFRKSVDSKGNIIEPDYKADKSLSATDYLDKSVVEKQYQYFSAWLVDPSNSDAISDPKDLVPITLKTLNYLIYKPVYNNGAKKIRTISAKESNYFNILQTIAQTFEAWLKLDIYREDEDEPGKITSKKISFKNYVGENNNASFQYGVNLKEISRQKSSKNIVTKLIVKQNNNTLAEDGFCTIARAGANPTGENYIYDFQYFHNQNIMNSAEYLNNTYYLDGAIGPDAELWNDETKVKSEEGVINPKGYYARLKKINNALTPIADQIAGFTETLVEKEADFAIAKSMKEAANSGMEQVRTDFYQLTGVYPEEAQDNTIELIALSTSADRPAIVPQEEWWKVSGTPSIADKTVTVTIAASSYQSTCYADIEVDDGTTLEWTTSSERKITKKGSWTGLYLVEDWEIGREYTMEYDLKYVGGTLENIGCHHSYFNNFSLTVTDKNGKTLTSPTTGDDTAVYPGEGKEITSFVKNETYHVKVVGTYYDGKI